MNDNKYDNIPIDKFTFIQRDSQIKDLKFDTKPIGYLKDAWNRFKKNKSSVIAAIIIIILFIFSIIVPIFSNYDYKFRDSYYNLLLPRNEFLSQYGIMQGYKNYTFNQQSYDYYNSIPGLIVEVKNSYVVEESGRTNTFYEVVYDTYLKPGYVYKLLTKSEYEALLTYEAETGILLRQPMVNTKEIQIESNKIDANYWFKHNAKGAAIYDKDGNYQDIFLKDKETGDNVYMQTKSNGEQYQVRVFYYDWFIYERGSEPSFLLGTDMYGQDILVRLAHGARFSFIFSIAVSAINLLIGLIYGAIEGYYGGKIDLFMERISDIISAIPFTVMIALFMLYFSKRWGTLLTIGVAFCVTSWIGTATRVRTQFYRYKGQEYVMAARTLGAKDSRLIFRHILPNAIGTLITTSVLMIPGVIFSETSLTYLGIIDLQSSDVTSIGTLLANGQASLSTFPHAIFSPALFISLLMISFNLFGNGLRDAFNPSLRGSEE